MLPRDYTAMVEGYNNKQRKKAELLRASVWAAKASWEGPISYVDWSHRFFPLWFDEIIDESPIQITKEQADEIIAKHSKYLKYNKKR